jgi:hypothetical protein
MTDADGTNGRIYILMRSVADVYSLRIGMTLRLRLDSLEVENLTVLANPGVNGITNSTQSYLGFVVSINSNSLTLRNAQGDLHAMRDVPFNNSTSFADMRNNSSISVTGLRAGMLVHVYYTSPTSNMARTVAILTADN